MKLKKISFILFFFFMGFIFFDKDKLLNQLSVLPFIKKMELVSFDSREGFFSAIFKKDENLLNLNGQLYPLNATYEATFDNLHALFPYVYGSLAAGGIVKKGNGLYFNGKTSFAGGYGNFEFICTTGGCRGTFKGSDFDPKKLLDMVGYKINFLKGKVSFGFTKNYNLSLSYSFNGRSTIPFDSFLHISGRGTILSPQSFSSSFSFYGDFGRGKGLLEKNKNYLFFHSNALIYLNKITKYTLFPFQGKVKLDFTYSTKDGILNFKNQDLVGYYSQGLNIQLNTTAKRFFEYLNITPFIKGNVTGTVNVKGKRGVFDLIFSNADFIPNKFINYIKDKANLNLVAKDTMFLRGFFDKEKIVFNFITKNRNYTMSVENGKYFYNGSVEFVINILKGDDRYAFKVKNGKIYLTMKKLKKDTLENEIIVY